MSKTELEEAPMTIVVGLDVHREQITFDALDTQTGEVRCGRVRPADRQSFRRFLRQFEGEPVEAALEATTGWRFIVEELQAAGAVAHLAEPAETRSLRGRKRRAKTDRLDARHLRNLLLEGRLPESWIPPSVQVDSRRIVGERPYRPRARAAPDGTASLDRPRRLWVVPASDEEARLSTLLLDTRNGSGVNA
jgi:hypothetical protein